MWTIIRSDRALAAALVVLGLAMPAAARADPPDVAVTSPPPAPASALDTLRERFREGMDKYNAGAFADAVVIWEAIYRELGSDRGYRLAFDLARAYDELGDWIEAADHYESYLDKVAQRRSQGETLEPNVARQEEIARDRRDAIAAAKARIRVRAAVHRPMIARVDRSPPRVAGFTVYVEPGAHVVTFGAGRDADVRNVTVARGELLDVEPRDDAPPPPTPEPRYETRVEHPFSPLVLAVGAGVALASVLVPVATYSHAQSIKSDYDSPSTSATDKQALSKEYDSARTNAYASILVPAAFTAGVGGLALWYVLGAKETRVPVTRPPPSPRPAPRWNCRPSFDPTGRRDGETERLRARLRFLFVHELHVAHEHHVACLQLVRGAPERLAVQLRHVRRAQVARPEFALQCVDLGMTSRDHRAHDRDVRARRSADDALLAQAMTLARLGAALDDDVGFGKLSRRVLEELRAHDAA